MDGRIVIQAKELPDAFPSGMRPTMKVRSESFGVRIPTGHDTHLEGDLVVPEDAKGIVLFAHGSGSCRLSPRNRYVADVLNHQKIATLLLDLLTRAEETAERYSGHLRFDIELLAKRLDRAVQWVRFENATRDLPVGLFGASTGAAAAAVTAVHWSSDVHAVVSRSGRADLAGALLRRVLAPTLLIVGGNDRVVLQLNRDAFRALRGVKRLEIVPGASHLFSEPGTLEQVAEMATNWFDIHLGS